MITVTTYTEGGSVDKTFTNVKMCILNDEGLCQIMRVYDGVSHLDTFTANATVNIQRTTA